MLLTSRMRGKSLATTSLPSSACRAKTLAFARYRLCQWCLNHHALRCRAQHAFVPWTVFDIADTPVLFAIFSVADGRSRTGAGGFGDRRSHELHQRHINISNNSAKTIRNDSSAHNLWTPLSSYLQTHKQRRLNSNRYRIAAYSNL